MEREQCSRRKSQRRSARNSRIFWRISLKIREIIADGVIEKDILETFNPKDEKNREKIENIVKKARINEKAMTREICKVGEEAAVAQLSRSHLQGRRKEMQRTRLKEVVDLKL